MADITKCSGIDCPLKEECFRFKAPESYFQSYFGDVPIVNGVCEYFMKIFKK
jgi:hypothetical protein